MGRVVAWRLLVAAALLPGVLAAVLSAAAVAGRLAGGGLWAPEELTLSEAAAIGDLPEIERLVGLGADPSAPSRVRRGFVPRRVNALLTPLSAAQATGHLDAVRLLLSLGAAPGAGDTRRE